MNKTEFKYGLTTIVDKETEMITLYLTKPGKDEMDRLDIELREEWETNKIYWVNRLSTTEEVQLMVDILPDEIEEQMDD